METGKSFLVGNKAMARVIGPTTTAAVRVKGNGLEVPCNARAVAQAVRLDAHLFKQTGMKVGHGNTESILGPFDLLNFRRRKLRLFTRVIEMPAGFQSVGLSSGQQYG